MPSKLEKTFTPQQERSRRTLDALLSATAALLEQNPFSEVSVNSIVKKANSSAGSFYARFEDKNALLHALHERFVENALTQMEGVLSDLTGQKIPIEALAEEIVSGVVQMFVDHRGVIRAAMMEALTDEKFAHRAFRLICAVSDRIACVVDAKTLSQDQLHQEIKIGLRTLMAILEQKLFFDAAIQQYLKPADKNPSFDQDRLLRIFLASMNIYSTN